MDVDQQTLLQILNSLADPVFVKDRSHHWVMLNDAYCQFMGHPRESLLGKSDYDFFPKEEADVFWKKDEEVFNSGLGNLNEEYFTDSHGVKHTILTKKTLYTDPSGNSHIVGIIRDITDRKKAEQSVVELARSEAEREQLELFAYVASHDLREPLQSIIGFSDLLKNRYAALLDVHGQGYIKRIQDAASRMSRLIDDLLKFSKVVKRAELFSLVDLDKLFQELIEDFSFQLQKIGGEISCGPMPTVEGDETQLRQLFQNMISNGLKFHAAGQKPKMSISCRPMPSDMVQISFTDNGIGIEEKFLDRIFRPFERLHTRAEYEGSGIGLAICEKIVAHHGGEIHVESKLGQGSTFFVVLPTTQPKN